MARVLYGRRSRLRVPAPLVRTSLALPGSEILTKLPHVGVPYFFIRQTYDTTRAQELLEPRGVRCPPFASYAPALVEFVERHPRL